MTTSPRIYIESCPIIDMAKHRAKTLNYADPNRQKERENNVWFCTKLLEAARNGHVEIYSCSLTISECTQVEEGIPRPSDDIMEFFNMLLCSGTSGITMVQPTQTILTAARNLKWIQEVNLKPLDAIHIAAAKDRGCSEFLTTDGKIFKNRDKLRSPSMNIIQAYETTLLPHSYRQEQMV